MELISLTKMSCNYIDRGNREVKNSKAIKDDTFKMMISCVPPDNKY